MNKTKKIILITVCAVLVAILLTATGCSLYANSQPYQEIEQPPEFLSKWMSYIATNTLLKNIAIPGSHDAGTYDMGYMGKTQDKDIATQLKYGVRYLDLRVYKEKDTLKLFHGPMVGGELEPMLKSVRAFLNNNNSEIVILDFQHFRNNCQDDTKQMIDNIFDSTRRIAKTPSTYTDSHFIDQLKYTTNTRGRVLIMWGSDSDPNMVDNNYIFKRNDDSGTRVLSALHSPYDGSLNKRSSTYYVDNALQTYIDTYKNELQGSGLFVLQGQLTDGLYIFGPRLRERTHSVNMNDYTRNLYGSDNITYINIIMRDFVDGTKVSHILNLNIAKNILVNNETKRGEYIDGLSKYIDVVDDM